MPQFTITGTSARVSAQVTWRDGDVEGDDLLIAEARLLARDRVEVGIPGLWAGPAGLDEHVQAVATLAYLMDPGYTIDGDEPDIEPLPAALPDQPDTVA